MFGAFAADVEKLALVCFSFVWFLQNLREWSKYLLGSIKTLINTTLAYWKDYVNMDYQVKDNNCSFVYHCEWLLRQHESGHFLTYGHFMSHPTAFHCRTPDLYWHFVTVLVYIWPQESEVLSIIRYRGTSKIAGKL